MEQNAGQGLRCPGRGSRAEGRNVERNPRQAISGKASDRTECMVPSACTKMGVEGGEDLELSGGGNSGHFGGILKLGGEASITLFTFIFYWMDMFHFHFLTKILRRAWPVGLSG